VKRLQTDHVNKLSQRISRTDVWILSALVRTENNTLCASVVGGCECTESLLTSRVLLREEGCQKRETWQHSVILLSVDGAKQEFTAYPDGQLVLFALDINDLDLEVDSDGGGNLVWGEENAINEAHEQTTLAGAAAANEEQLEGSDCF